MLSHNEGLYNVFTHEHVARVIAASTQMPTLENLLQQLTTYCAEQMMTGDSDQSAIKIDACHKLVDAAIQYDNVTHLYDANFDTLMINAVNAYQSKNPQHESYIVEGDFSNLFNCNKAIGKQRTNEIMAVIINMYQQAFKHISPAPQLVYGSRSGGDEFRFIVSGISEDGLKSAIQSARENIENFVAELGLTQIEHSKYTGNPVKTGIGAEVAYKKLPVEFPSYELESELDTIINENKLTAGQRKVQRGFNTIENPADIANSPERLHRVDDVLEKYKITARPPQKPFPFHGLKDEETHGHLFQRHREQVEHEARQLNMNGPQTEIFLSLLQNIYHKRDEKTNMMPNRDFIACINHLMSHAKQMGIPCFVIKMEAHNFSTLNEIFSHFGNDTIFRHMADITARNLANVNTVFFARGGGIISPITTENGAEQLNHVLEKIIDEFHNEIGNKTIAEYCQQHDINYSSEALKKLHIDENTKINQIPNIRGLHAGCGFIISMTDIRKSANHVEVLSTLDKSNDQNKKAGVALKTDDVTIDLAGKKHRNVKALRKFINMSKLLFYKPTTKAKDDAEIVRSHENKK